MERNKNLEYYENISKEYGISSRKSGSLWLQAQVRLAALKILKKICPTSLLEVGVGNGLFILRAAEELPNCRFVGIDFSQKMLEILSLRLKNEEINNVKLVLSDASYLAFQNNAFETIMLVNTLSSIPIRELDTVIKELYRILLPGGYLYFDFKNKLNPIVVWRIKNKKADLTVNSYTIEDINYLMQKNNFKLASTSGIVGLLSFGSGKLAPSVGVVFKK